MSEDRASKNARAPGELTALFDFALEDSQGAPVAQAQAVPPAPTGACSGASRYAGFIVQQRGRIQTVLPWEGSELCAGRSRECEIQLSSPQISRRHALFTREGDRCCVRDLDSVAGIRVNGERVLECALEVGDVVCIGEYELTFVLDDRPIGETVRADPPPPCPQPDDPAAVTLLAPTQPLAERPGSEPALEGIGEGLPIDSPAADPIAEIDLLTELESGEEDKETSGEWTTHKRRARSAPAPAEDPAEEVWSVELRVDPARLPAALQALLGEEVLHLPLEVQLRSRHRAGRRD